MLFIWGCEKRERERDQMARQRGVILFLTPNNWKTREGEFERHKW